MKNSKAILPLSIFLLVSHLPVLANTASTDVVQLVSKQNYKNQGVKITLVDTATKFKNAVNAGEAARKELDQIQKTSPNDKQAYKSAMRKLLDADDEQDKFQKHFTDAANLKEAGYALTAPIDAVICNGGVCAPADPGVILFFIIGSAAAEEGNKKDGWGPNNEIVKFLNRPLGGPGSELVKARDWAMDRLGIGGENNDLGRVVRNPGQEFKRGDIGKTVCNWFGC